MLPVARETRVQNGRQLFHNTAIQLGQFNSCYIQRFERKSGTD